jgi:hypothetical protein
VLMDIIPNITRLFVHFMQRWPKKKETESVSRLVHLPAGDMS